MNFKIIDNFSIIVNSNEQQDIHIWIAKEIENISNNIKRCLSMKLKDLYFNDLEIITAITLNYADDIEFKLLVEKGEVLQEDFTKITYQLFCEYIKLKTNSSLLDLVNKKYLKIS